MVHKVADLDYYRDSLHTYMVVRCEDHVVTSGYQYRMMEMNRIKGLLACDIRSIDGQKYLYYDITGRQSMHTLFEGKSIRKRDIVEFLTSLRNVRSSLSSYLLDETNIVLESRQIYYDFAKNTYVFTYNPDAKCDNSHVFTFISEKVDLADHDAAAMAYRLCEQADRDMDRIQSVVEEELRKTEIGSDFSDTYIRNKQSANFMDPDQSTEFGAEKSESDSQAVEMKESKAENDYRTKGHRKKVQKNGEHKSEEWALWRTIFRAFLILFLLAGMIGLFALPEIMFLTITAARLCRVGSVLLLVVEVFMIRDLILANKERASKKHKQSNSTRTRRDGSYAGSSDRTEKKQRYGSDANIEMNKEYRLSAEKETVLLNSTDLVGKLYGSGVNRGTRISFDRFPFTIGKAEQYVDCTLNDESVSRMHARVLRDEDGKICIKDLGSTNGTYVNGTRLRPNETAALERGDELILGSVEFLYR